MKGWHKVRASVSKSSNLFFIIISNFLTNHVLFFSPSLQRYFILEKGILKYSKAQQDVSERQDRVPEMFPLGPKTRGVTKPLLLFQIQRGKLHGSLDVSLAVMSINKKSKRIDLDAGDNLYHLKVE